MVGNSLIWTRNSWQYWPKPYRSISEKLLFLAHRVAASADACSFVLNLQRTWQLWFGIALKRSEDKRLAIEVHTD